MTRTIGILVCLLVACSFASAVSQVGQVRAGDPGGGGVIPGPFKSLGNAYGGAVASMATTRVQLVDLEGAPFVQVWVVVRDELGAVVAAKLTDEAGQATVVTSGVGAFTVDAIELGVCDVPFTPGTKVLIVIDP